jgi:hypothetical protein
MREPVDWPMHARSIRNLAVRVQLHGSIEEAQWLLKAAAKIDKRIPSATAEARDDGSGRRGQVVAFASRGSPATRHDRTEQGRTELGRTELGRTEPGRAEPSRRLIGRHGISQEAEIDYSPVQKTTYRQSNSFHDGDSQVIQSL